MIGDLLIGRYLVLKQLGVGGFSETYLVRDKYLPKHPLCVVKCLRSPSDMSITAELGRELLQREAKILQEVTRQHDRLPWLLAYSGNAELPCLVEEYIDGEDLEIYIERSRVLNESELVCLLQDTLELLDFVHKRNIIHHDVKPSNLIRRRQDGRIALIDFGASIHPGEAPFPGDLSFGTPGYIAPEQEAGRATFSSDLYSLGVTAIQLLTGVHPQQLKPSPISAELNWHSYLDRRTIDPRLVALIDKLVRHKLPERYAQAIDALNDLACLLGTGALEHRPLAWSGGVPLSLWQRVRRKSRWVVGLVGIASLVIALSPVDEEVMRSVPEMAKTFQESGSEAIKFLMAQLSTGKQRASVSLLHTLSVEQEVVKMEMLSDKILVTVHAGNQIQLWQVEQGKALKSWKSGSKTVTVLATSPDHQLLVTAGNDRKVQIWELPSGRLLSTIVGHSQSIKSMAVSRDNKTLAVSGEDNSIQIWDLGKLEVVRKLAGSSKRSMPLMYVPANLLVHTAKDHTLEFWRARQGELQYILAGHTDAVLHFKLSPEQHSLYSFGKDRLIEWSLKDRTLIRSYPPESGNASSAQFQGKYVVTLHQPGTIRLWDRSSGELLQTISHPGERILLCPQGQFLISMNSNKSFTIRKLQIN
jgi:serine/threonine protein kinase